MVSARQKKPIKTGNTSSAANFFAKWSFIANWQQRSKKRGENWHTAIRAGAETDFWSQIGNLILTKEKRFTVMKAWYFFLVGLYSKSFFFFQIDCPSFFVLPCTVFLVWPPLPTYASSWCRKKVLKKKFAAIFHHHPRDRAVLWLAFLFALLKGGLFAS